MMNAIVENAIDRSKFHNETVHIGPIDLRQAGVSLETVRVELLMECESNVEANGTEEFWGRDCDGATWRVHVALPSISADELSEASGCADAGGGNAVEDCNALYD